jgi:hypothetical protein
MPRRIFRPAALQRYNNSLNKLVLPRYASPPWRVGLWVLIGLLLALTALLWYAQTPIYVTGPGVVVRTPAGFPGEGEVVLAVFLPPEVASHVQVGQPVIIHLAGLATDEPAIRLTQTVTAVDRTVAAPVAVRTRYGLDDSTGLLIDGPTVVALIRLNTPAETMLGSIGEVQIEIGAQRSLALLPGLGRFFGVDNLDSR